MLLCITTSSLHGMLSYRGVFFGLPRQSALFRALYSYDAEKIKKLIMDGADVNEKDSNDTSFLWQVIDSRKHFSEKEVIDIVDDMIGRKRCHNCLGSLPGNGCRCPTNGRCSIASHRFPKDICHWD